MTPTPKLQASRQREAPASAPARMGVVQPLPVVGDDTALVAALRSGHPGAAAALFDRYGTHVQRVLVRVLGPDPDLPDLLHDVFVTCLERIGTLRDPAALPGWVTNVAVFTARGLIRRRSRRRWLDGLFLAWGLRRVAVPPPDPSVSEGLRAAYHICERMPAGERIAFALRIFDGRELTDVAAACAISLATAKRRIARAEATFLAEARAHPALRDWLAEGTRWTG